MDHFDYPVMLTPQPEGGFVVTFPDVPEAITQGEDEYESLLYAVDALETALSLYVDQRKSLPLPCISRTGAIHRPTFRSGVRQTRSIPGHDGTRCQKNRIGPAIGLASASSRSPVRPAPCFAAGPDRGCRPSLG